MSSEVFSPFRQFRTYGLQSALIVLAIAFGVAVVVAVAAFIDLGRQADRQFTGSVWAREITLTSKEGDWSAFWAGGIAQPVRELGQTDAVPVELSLEDVEKVRDAVPSAAYVYTMVSQFIDSAATSATYLPAFGVTEDYLAANDIKVTNGSLFTQQDFDDKRSVALLSPKLLKQTKIAGDPIGKKLAGFEIIGVLAENDVPDAFSPEMIIPFPANPYDSIDKLTVVVRNIAEVDEARAELEAFATKTWGEGVNVRSNDVTRYRARTRTTGLVVAVLASLGLVIASLNIMNLLVARVLKGAKDIGVLRSLGATRADIIRRYLGNALTLGVLGSVLGTGLGYGLIVAFNTYVRTATPDEEAQQYLLSLSLPVVGVGIIIALGITLLFSLYPALLASRTHVVDALKGL